MKKPRYNTSFSLLKCKNRKKLRAVSLVVAVSAFLLCVCSLVILLSVSHINHNLMNNNNLMLIQMFGYSREEDTCYIDISHAQSIEHIVFATESFPLSIALFREDGSMLEDESIVVHRIDPEFCEYFGITDMKENVIYSPSNGVKNIHQYTLQEPYDSCNVVLENYDGVAPAVLQKEEFAAISTYDSLRNASHEESVYFSTPEYLIGVDSVENVYTVIRSLHEEYPDYELKMFYQAQGLERLVSGSKNMVYIEILSLLSVIVACYFITRALMHSMLHAITKEMMLMHMHGMSRKTISTQFFTFVVGIVKPKLVVALACSAIIFLWLSAISFRDEMGALQFLITALIVLLVFGLNAIGLKKSIHKKVCESTSNENISRMLRN